MGKTYRIDGAGNEQAFLEAADMANQAVIDIAGVGGTTNILTWLSYLLSAAGAAAASFVILRPLLETFPILSGPEIFFLAIVCGITLYVLALVILNRWIARGTARAYLSDPTMLNHHVLLSDEGMRVVSGQTYTQFHWSDVTRIEATAHVILVMAGMAWAYIPISCFAKLDDAKAALADMRAWQKAAQA